MNSSLPAKTTTRSKVFAGWNERNKVIEWLLIIITIASSVANYFALNLFIVASIDALMILLVCGYFQFRVWSSYIRLVWWMGRLGDELTDKNIILCPGNVTTLSLFLDFGPKVKHWILRLSLPAECFFVSVPQTGEYTVVRGRNDKKCCLHRLGNANEITAVFFIEALRKTHYSPDVQLFLESLTNEKTQQIQKKVIPCRTAIFENPLPFKCVIVPSHLWPP